MLQFNVLLQVSEVLSFKNLKIRLKPVSVIYYKKYIFVIHNNEIKIYRSIFVIEQSKYFYN